MITTAHRRTAPALRRARRTAARGLALGAMAALLLGSAWTATAEPAFAAPSGESTGLGYNYDTTKQEQPRLTVSPAEGLVPDEPSTVTLRGEQYATSTDQGTTFGGAYTLFGAIQLKDADDPGSWAPTKRGVAGTNYDYAPEAGLYQLMVNYPGNSTEPGMPYMDQNGDWTLEEHPIPGAQFTSQTNKEIDCLAEGTQCGFMTIGAHGQRSAGVEVFTPVYFEGQDPEDSGENPDESGEDPDDSGENPDDSGEDSDDSGQGSTDPCEAETPEDLLTNEEYVVAGSALADTDAVMTVKPGRYLPCDDATEIVVEGQAYDSTKPIYVGLGAPKNHDDLEQWRRSNGGFSGPDGDYDYGVPRLVVANGSSDGDVADAEMDAEGNWSLTVEVPGKDIESFFGGTIDCAVAYCGFFSFGAHGNVVAQNEAFTPVFFGGQDPDDAPPAGGGDDDDPTDLPAGTNGGGNGTGTGGSTQPAGFASTPTGGANSGVGVNGGLATTGAGDGARTTVIGGVLLLSAGLLGAALLRNRRLTTSGAQ
ncbi:hypothetical protein [Microbacterium sp.]|uniref:hypothetical protein n=1 Tax=Microbacterium sp. TaxID=51671 RepID=UPI003F9B25ED